jgi:hypothetical protein
MKGEVFANGKKYVLFFIIFANGLPYNKVGVDIISNWYLERSMDHEY